MTPPGIHDGTFLRSAGEVMGRCSAERFVGALALYAGMPEPPHSRGRGHVDHPGAKVSTMNMSRRKFLTIGAGAALGTVVAPAALRSSAAMSAGASAVTLAGNITDVKHVVVLMQENRSFDHYFGRLSGVRGFSDHATILQSGGYSIFNQKNGSARQYPWRLSDTAPAWGQTPETLAQCDGSLDHGWSTQHSAWHTGLMDAWVAAKSNVRTLGYLDRADIPFHYALADNYTICDSYFCSTLSATGPNRTFLWSGMIDPAGTQGGPANDGGDESGLRWPTYAEALQNAGVSWRVYQNADDNYGDNGLAYFTQFANASAGNPLYDRGMASVPEVTGSTPDDIVAAIRADVLGGTLPKVSWVVANQGFSEHPYAPPNDGMHFVHLVLNALFADPDVGNSTVLLLNYDENDGFFDHVPPPVAPAGTAGEFVGSTPVGLGFRVPLLVMSPWSRGGWVNSEVFDHTSVIRFLETWTAALGTPATCPNISGWRRSICGDLTSTFDFGSPVFGLPSLPDTSTVIGISTCTLLPNPAPAANVLPTQEAGTRPARALPYQPNANIDHLEFGSGGQILAWIRMSNTGVRATRSAHYAVYANAFRTGGPWQYTVAPYSAATGDGTTLDFFNIGSSYGDGAYDLSVIGPNRFLRRFVGNATTAAKSLEARSSYAVEPGTGQLAVYFALSNTGASAATFTITSNQYRGDGPWTYSVPAGGTVSDFFNAAAYTHGWYDFTITTDTDPSWMRRFVGHLETGQPSITG